MDRRTFINEEFMGLAIRAALQRARIYAQATDSEREQVRDRMYSILAELAPRYASQQSETQHERHIEDFAERMTEEFGPSLKCGKFRIGISQKALNLYLKYLWCNGEIPIPPHCPFDAIIISAIGMSTKWTEVDSIDEYRALVAAARRCAGDVPLAEWELSSYPL